MFHVVTELLLWSCYIYVYFKYMLDHTRYMEHTANIAKHEETLN